MPFDFKNDWEIDNVIEKDDVNKMETGQRSDKTSGKQLIKYGASVL